jgi:Synergist-CTERM protein sorting domain-containing protein
MKIMKKLCLTLTLIAAFTAFAPLCAFASFSLPSVSTDCLDGSTYVFDMTPISNDKSTELCPKQSLWTYNKIVSSDVVSTDINENGDMFEQSGTLVAAWGPFTGFSSIADSFGRIKLNISASTDKKLIDMHIENMYLYFVVKSGDSSIDVTGAWLTKILHRSGDYNLDVSMDYIDVPSSDVTSEDWNTNTVYMYMVKASDGDSGGSGCNAGFGALALIAAVPLFWRKRK